jgi:hypothetical protein
LVRKIHKQWEILALAALEVLTFDLQNVAQAISFTRVKVAYA